jgi:uncharacterized membrane protein YfcA
LLALSLPELLVTGLSIVVAAMVHGWLGFGFSFVSVPVLAVVHPEALPSVVLLLMIPMTAVMAVRERSSIDTDGLLWLLLGRLAGTIAALTLLASVSQSRLSLVFGVLLVAGVVMISIGPTVRLDFKTQLFTGVASGVMSTAAALGGPPQALLYRERSGPMMRSTLAVSFFGGMVISIVGLALGGHLHTWHFVLTLALYPTVAAGLLLSRFLSGLLDERWLRVAVLVFAGAMGTMTVLRSFL